MSTMPILQLLERYLTLTSDRNQVIISNMSNVDTPGYHTRDIDFQAELRRLMNASTTVQSSPALKTVSGLIERPDGNNVNLDREGMLLAETQLQYQLGVQLVKTEFHRLLTAINEGK